MKNIILILLLCGSAVQAQTVSEDKPELEVQRREFESHLSAKVDSALEAIVEKGTYILDIAVTLKKLPAEVIEVGGREDERFPLDSSAKYDGAAGLVPLSKIGVWNRGVADGKKRTITRQVRNFADLIQSVSVDLYLDPDKVSVAQKKSVDRVVQAILKSSSPVQAALTLTDLKIFHPKKVDENLKADLVTQIKKELAAEKPAPVAEKPGFFAEFKNPIAIVFTAVMLFALGLIMNRRQALNDERRLRLDEEISRRNEELLRSSEASKADAVVNGAPGGQDGIDLGDSGKQAGGFVKFGEIVADEPARAGYLLKQWIYSTESLAQGALALLPRLVSTAQLTSVLELLSDDDRKEWNRLMNKPSAGVRFGEVDGFVAKSVASSMVEPAHEIDQQARQLLATLTPQEGADCISLDKTVGVLFVQTLPSLQVSRIFNLIDEQIIRDIAFSSTTIDKTQVGILSIKFQQLLKKVRGAAKAQSSSFVERVPELIREVGFSKEAALFDSVAQTRNIKLLQQIATEYLPSELIPSLPTDVIKAVFERLPLGERAELIFSQNESMRRVLFSTVGEGRLRDVLDIEMEEIQANDIRVRSITRSAGRIWQNFLDRVRQKINESPELRQELEPLIEGWVKQRVEELGSGGTRAAA